MQKEKESSLTCGEYQILGVHLDFKNHHFQHIFMKYGLQLPRIVLIEKVHKKISIFAYQTEFAWVACQDLKIISTDFAEICFVACSCSPNKEYASESFHFLHWKLGVSGWVN